MGEKTLPQDKSGAGFKILYRFQSQWENMHFKTENNLSKIGMITDKIDHLERSATRRLQSLDELNDCCKSLGTINDQIRDINSDLIQLERSIPMIESVLMQLKNQKEEQDLRSTLSQMDNKFQADKQAMVDISNARKEKLRTDHNKRIEAYEQKQLQELDERRLILEKAFEEEKQRYLNEGS